MRTRASSDSPAWQPAFRPPPDLTTGSWRLEPLHPRLADLDFAAWSSCRERLVAELDWSGWPGADFTVEDNLADLAEHYDEFERRAAYAYSVLTSERCIGCIYVEPWRDGAQLAWWLIDAHLPHEEAVLAAVLGWLGTWPFPRIILPVRPWNARARSVLDRMGLWECEGPEGHVSYTSIV